MGLMMLDHLITEQYGLIIGFLKFSIFLKNKASFLEYCGLFSKDHCRRIVVVVWT